MTILNSTYLLGQTPIDFNVQLNVRKLYYLSFVIFPGMSCSGVRRAKAAFLSGCKSHPAILLQPEAIGAVMEVTKWLKPSM